MEPHHEASPLLGEKRIVTEVPVVENNRLWKFALVAVGLSAMGLIATSTSMGGNFHITSFDSASANIRGSSPTNTPPLVANTPPLASGTQGSVPLAGGPLPVAEGVPSGITDVLVRVSDSKVSNVDGDNTKSNTNGPASSSSAKSLPLQSTGKLMTSSNPTLMTSSNEDIAVVSQVTDTTSESTTVSTDATTSTVILPGSPNDPKLAVERAKKVEAEEVVQEAVAAAAVEEPVAVVVTVAAPVPPVIKEQPVAKEPKTDASTTTETTEETTSTTEDKTGGKHGSKATVDIPDKPTEDETKVGEETTVTAESATVDTVVGERSIVQ